MLSRYRLLINFCIICTLDGYNKYVEVVGHSIGIEACANVRRDGKIYHIKNNTKLLHFLSDTDSEEEENDWLYVVIADIVSYVQIHACSVSK